MTVLKQMIIVAMIALHLQPSLQASTRKIYDNAMQTSLQNTDDHKMDFYQNVQMADPYFWHKHMYKAAGCMKDRVSIVLDDFIRDMNNDQMGYILKLVLGTSAGMIGGVSGGFFGMFAGALSGFTIGGAEHYTERRFFSDDYTQEKKEWKKKQLRQKEEAKQKAKKMHTSN